MEEEINYQFISVEEFLKINFYELLYNYRLTILQIVPLKMILKFYTHYVKYVHKVRNKMNKCRVPM